MQLALLQLRDYGSVEENRARTLAKIAEAAARGAQIVCTQELFTTAYFCITQDPANFDLAETIPGPTTDALCLAAKKHVLPFSVICIIGHLNLHIQLKATTADFFEGVVRLLRC